MTLYELVTLEPAFGGRDRQELLRQIAFEEPKTPRRLNRAIPAELETIVLKALEKNPAERYATAKELADDLRHWLEDRPIQARRPTLVQRAGKWLRRHPSVMRSTMLVLLLAVVASATGAWLLWQEQRKTQLALDGETRQRKAAELATQILGSVFRDLDPQTEEEGGPALRVQLGERLADAARRVEGASASTASDPVAVAYLQAVLGASLLGLGQYGKALAIQEKASQTLESALGPNHPDTLASKNNLAVLYCACGDYGRAEALLREVLQVETAQPGGGRLP